MTDINTWTAKSLLHFRGFGMNQEDGARASQNQSRILPNYCHHVAGTSREEMLWEGVGQGYHKVEDTQSTDMESMCLLPCDSVRGCEASILP